MTKEFEYSDGILYSSKTLSIEFAINEDPNLIYFKVFKEDHSDNCMRISMTEPKIINSNIEITNIELEFVIDMVTKNWNYLIEMINSERVNSYAMEPINISIPDYNKLLGGK